MFEILGFLLVVVFGGYLVFSSLMGAYICYAFSGRIQKGDAAAMLIALKWG